MKTSSYSIIHSTDTTQTLPPQFLQEVMGFLREQAQGSGTNGRIREGVILKDADVPGRCYPKGEGHLGRELHGSQGPGFLHPECVPGNRLEGLHGVCTQWRKWDRELVASLTKTVKVRGRSGDGILSLSFSNSDNGDATLPVFQAKITEITLTSHFQSSINPAGLAFKLHPGSHQFSLPVLPPASSKSPLFFTWIIAMAT